MQNPCFKRRSFSDEFSLSLDDDLVVLAVDRRLRRELPDARLLLTVHDELVLEVADDGPGIPAPERQQVLERFYRLDSSRSTPGAGLGLSLVTAVAELHQARLELLDNAPGLAPGDLIRARIDRADEHDLFGEPA